MASSPPELAFCNCTRYISPSNQHFSVAQFQCDDVPTVAKRQLGNGRATPTGPTQARERGAHTGGILTGCDSCSRRVCREHFEDGGDGEGEGEGGREGDRGCGDDSDDVEGEGGESGLAEESGESGKGSSTATAAGAPAWELGGASRPASGGDDVAPTTGAAAPKAIECPDEATASAATTALVAESTESVLPRPTGPAPSPGRYIDSVELLLCRIKSSSEGRALSLGRSPGCIHKLFKEHRTKARRGEDELNSRLNTHVLAARFVM